MRQETIDRLARQLVQQKEAILRRALANAFQYQPEPPGLADLHGRLACYTVANETEVWCLDGHPIAAILKPTYVGSGDAVRVMVQGEVLNEPEAPAIESSEVIHHGTD